jgi:hypothetical protein
VPYIRLHSTKMWPLLPYFLTTLPPHPLVVDVEGALTVRAGDNSLRLHAHGAWCVQFGAVDGARHAVSSHEVRAAGAEVEGVNLRLLGNHGFERRAPTGTFMPHCIVRHPVQKSNHGHLPPPPVLRTMGSGFSGILASCTVSEGSVASGVAPGEREFLELRQLSRHCVAGRTRYSHQ